METQGKETQVDSTRLIRDLLDRWEEENNTIAIWGIEAMAYDKAWIKRDLIEQLLTRYFNLCTREEIEEAYNQEFGPYMTVRNKAGE